MTETPVKLEGIALMRLDEASVKGLMPIQIEAMRETAINVNNAMAVAGNATRSAMEDLSALKRNVGHSNWTAFLNSGVLSVSAKIAADLVNAHDKWLANDGDVTDMVIGSLSARAMVAIANAQPSTRTLVKAKILAGATSEVEIRNAIKAAEGKPTEAKDKTPVKRVDKVRQDIKDIASKASNDTSVDEFMNIVKALKDYSNEIITNNNEFRSEAVSKDNRIKKLEEQVASLKKQLSGLEAQAKGINVEGFTVVSEKKKSDTVGV